MSSILQLPSIINILRYTGQEWPNHMGFTKGECGSWAKNLGLPKGGDIIIYPGCCEMEIAYMPIYIKNAKEIWGNGEITKEEFLKTLRKRLDEEYPKLDKVRFDLFALPLRAAVKLLKEVGYKIGFLYDEEPFTCIHYSKVGLEDLIQDYVKKKYKVFKEYGVKKVITTSPMSVGAMLNIYPQYIDNFDLEVDFYLNAVISRIDKLPKKSITKEPVVVHDCHNWGRTFRELNVPDKLRTLLEYVGGIDVEPRYNKETVHCCGAPSGLIDPETSALIGKNRLMELLEPMDSSGARKIVMACPNCFNTLYNALQRFGPKDVEMYDIAYYTVKRLFGGVE